MVKEKAPIVLFTYNRPDLTELTLKSLSQNVLANESKLFIFSDGPKNGADESLVLETRSLFKNYFKYFQEVHLHESFDNKGLASSIIQGVSKVLSEHSKVIVLEDDLVTSKNFLTFLNKSLDFYQSTKDVYSISGYSFPLNFPRKYKYDIYFGLRASSWGWGTWSDRWSQIDWEVKDYDSFLKNPKKRKRFNRGGADLSRLLDAQMKGKIDSWAIRWCYYQFINNQYTVFPTKSKVQHIGCGSKATHVKRVNIFDTDIDSSISMDFQLPSKILLEEELLKQFKFKFSRINKLKQKLIDLI
ncbi:sugar transferase [Fulvivirga sp. M361]|uniref:sugar transferase n=1 Tax=Fulvivirga sp. M361 TaxID=2594266 RepID=UPI00117ADB09|nr:sugar transferase [Fulvivirga sp. M361]TRX51649.1 sugar transferase [Fulvivirga sp. M361]